MPIDPHSQTWAEVVERAGAMMRVARDVTTQPGLDPVATEFARGRISALADILALGQDQEPPTITTDSGNYGF